MSEPVSKAEIEDVLSSIRRLVSENTGAIKREPEVAELAERLVLTPAFRVDDGAGNGGDDTGAAEPADEATPEAMVAQVVDAANDDETSMAAEAADASEATAQAEGEAQPLSPLEQRIAELETVISRSAAEFEPEASEVEEIGGGYVFQHSAPEAEVAEPEAEPEAGGEADAAADLAEAEQAEPEPEAVAEPEPEPEAAAEPMQDWEDVAPTMAAADTAEDTDAWDEPFETGLEVAGLSDADAEAVIDEEALREMVARMVREELQGSVGERITHNVRRMVRREIARALSLQNFE